MVASIAIRPVDTMSASSSGPRSERRPTAAREDVLTHKDKPAGPPGIPRQPAGSAWSVSNRPRSGTAYGRSERSSPNTCRRPLRLHLLRGETAAEITLEDRLPADQPPLEKPLPLESE
jgi:hypothetical protein